MKDMKKQTDFKKQLVRFIKDFGLIFDASEFGYMCDTCGEKMALHTYGHYAIRSFTYDYLKPYLYILFDLYMGKTPQSGLFKFLKCEEDSFLIDKFLAIRNIRDLVAFIPLLSTYCKDNSTISYTTTTNLRYDSSAFKDWSSQNFNYQIDNVYGI